MSLAIYFHGHSTWTGGLTMQNSFWLTSDPCSNATKSYGALKLRHFREVLINVCSKVSLLLAYVLKQSIYNS